ncbi:aspartate aminotransferase family protein [Bradyrhizobium iriomotense]|uniref:aspartate aminotransferase family protein n=1 Tax=Bradyrhizobium iriomotense TaxID=441950 RepID=UPI001B8A4B75|nr:aspartate aminotransferase family protein [Bradyrhizobium iriomotense]
MSRPLMVNAFDPARTAKLADDVAALLERRKRVLGPSYKLFYEDPVHVIRAEGVWLHGADGTKYLDVYNNVPAVGHCHPRVVEAIARQAATLNTHTRYLYEVVITYAERLIATFPNELANVMFTCTGSESSDLAVRVAKSFTGGAGIIVTENAYHGITAAVSEFSPSLGEGVPLGQHVRTVPAPDSYRLGPQVGEIFADHVQRAVDDLRRHGIKPAALVTDTIFSSDGILSDPAGFLAPAVDVIRRAGGVFIADEVQPGFARTGDAMWGFQRHKVVPDIVIMGKPMGNGIPLAGVVARPEVLNDFASKARYFNTFGGNPVSCAAGLAVLDVIAEEKLQRNALDVGNYIKAGLRQLAREHDCIGDVRGAGLFIGADFVRDRESKTPAPEVAMRLVNDLRRKNILISASGLDGHVLKIRPPLPFSREDADIFLAAMGEVLQSSAES